MPLVCLPIPTVRNINLISQLDEAPVANAFQGIDMEIAKKRHMFLPVFELDSLRILKGILW